MDQVVPRDLIGEKLAAVEARMRAWALPAGHPLRAALEELMNSGGKRIRPALVLLCGEVFRAPTEPVIDLAAAVEVLHTATLIHDDLIDHSSLRRGAPTLHTRWPAGLTVLAGDYLFAWSAHLSARVASVPVIQSFADSLIELIGGEISQHTNRAEPPDLAGYESRIRAKTATLFEVSCSGPAMLTDQPPAVVDAAREFGLQLGMAFQAADDILDYVGHRDEAGKPVAADLQQGLLTLPAILYRQAHPEDSDLAALIGGAREPERVERLIDTIRRSGAIDQARAQTCAYANAAIRCLESFPEGIHRDALAAMATTIVGCSS